MKRYNIDISLKARQNINDYINFIRNKYKSPLTAERHLIGLLDVISSLHSLAETIQLSMHDSVLIYGPNARSIKYKKMCIIYTVQNERIIVHELKPCSMIISSI